MADFEQATEGACADAVGAAGEQTAPSLELSASGDPTEKFTPEARAAQASLYKGVFDGDASEPLPPNLLGRFSQSVGRDLSHVRLHDDDAADDMAQSHDALALTFGSDIFFRAGQLDPQSTEGQQL